MASIYYTPPQYPRTDQMPPVTGPPVTPPSPVTPPPPVTPGSPESTASPQTPNGSWDGQVNSPNRKPLTYAQRLSEWEKAGLLPGSKVGGLGLSHPGYQPIPTYDGAPADRTQWSTQQRQQFREDRLAHKLKAATLTNQIKEQQNQHRQLQIDRNDGHKGAPNPYYQGLYGGGGGGGDSAGGSGWGPNTPGYGSMHKMEYTNNPNLNRYGRFDINLPYGGYAPPQTTMLGNTAQGWFPYLNPRSQASTWGSNIYSYKW